VQRRVDRRSNSGAALLNRAEWPSSGIEDPFRQFFLGVQWHPENFYRTGEFRALFEGFIEAARK
jgi:CTP synthase (UTP-ammonia lyase)